jgi:hypothetical protein
VLDFDNSKAIVVLVLLRYQYCIRIRFFLRCGSAYYSYNHNSQFTVASSHRCWVNRKPRWRFGQEVNSTSSWYTRSSRVRKVILPLSWVYPVAGSELCSLILTNWFGSQENFSQTRGLPGIERVPWITKGLDISVIISKEKKSSSDCINNWTWVSLTRNSSSKGLFSTVALHIGIRSVSLTKLVPRRLFLCGLQPKLEFQDQDWSVPYLSAVHNNQQSTTRHKTVCFGSRSVRGSSALGRRVLACSSATILGWSVIVATILFSYRLELPSSIVAFGIILYRLGVVSTRTSYIYSIVFYRTV